MSKTPLEEESKKCSGCNKIIDGGFHSRVSDKYFCIKCYREVTLAVSKEAQNE